MKLMMEAAWNQKNLDYEIETPSPHWSENPQANTWNQKNLDYEIETEFRQVRINFQA